MFFRALLPCLVLAGCTTGPGADADRGPLGKADRVGSCEVATCGTSSADGNCFCDDECTAFGDCCDNYRGVCEAPLSFTTYNAGLARGAVTFTEERLPSVVEALRQSDADVLCLQEVWDDSDAELIERELAAGYPHNFREVTKNNSRYFLPQCGPIGLWRVKSCVEGCTADGKSTFECVANDCKERYDTLSDDCQLCLAANTTSPASCALPAARKYAWGGRNGLMLLSKKPLDDPHFIEFDTLLLGRGALAAEVDGVQVQCTHLTSDLSSVPYPDDREFSNWEEEQLAQLGIASDASDSDRCTVLLGDLNTGPDTAKLDAELANNFRSLLDLGYEENWDDRECTYCASNPLVGGEKSHQLDHIMTRGCSGSVTYSVALDREITITDEQGVEHTTALSDHYGLSAVVGGATD